MSFTLTNMDLSFNSQHYSTPDLEEILRRLPLEEKHLGQLSLQPDGVEQAAKYAENMFETQFGDDIQRALGAAAAQKKEITRLEELQQTAKDYLLTLRRKLALGDSEKDKPPMSITTMFIQFFLAGTVLLLLGLGAHNFAVLLIKTGEPFLTNPWAAYATALTGATIFAVVMECFICLAKNDTLKRFTAMICLGVGVICGLCYLAILSHIVPPDFTESNVASLIPSLGSSSVPAIHEESFFGKSVQGWLLFFQFVAEATGATGLSYFFVNNLKAHRAARRRDDPEYLDATKDLEDAAKRVKSAEVTLADMEGFLRVMGEARELIISKAVTSVSSLKNVIEMIMKVASIKRS